MVKRLLLLRRGYLLLGLLHLILHGLFKRLLFLQGGRIIHSSWGEQIKSKMIGGRVRISSIYNLALFSLIGLPYLRGIITKDLFITYLSFYQILFWFSLRLTFLYSLSLIRVPKKVRLFLSYHKRSKIFSGLILFLLAIILGRGIEEIRRWEKSIPLLYSILFLLVITPFSNYLNRIVPLFKERGKYFESLLSTHLGIKLSPLLLLLFFPP